jgi:hypothetical protein
MEEKSRRTKLPHIVIRKAPGLLPMLYCFLIFKLSPL